MYIKLFTEDYDNEGTFLPIQLEIFSQVLDRWDPFGKIQISYFIDNRERERPFLPLFKHTFGSTTERPSCLEGGRFSDVDSVLISPDGISLRFQPHMDASLQETISYDSMLDAVEAAESMMIRIDIACGVYDEKTHDTSETETEIAESYSVTFGWDEKLNEIVTFITLDTADNHDEFYIG